jgi:hypothetical protein
LFLIVVFFLFYLFISLPQYYDHNIVNIFKDLKFIFFGIILYGYIKINDISSYASESIILKAIKVNFFVSVFIYFLMYNFNFHMWFTNDEYYNINELRYLNYGISILPFYLIYAWTTNRIVKVSTYIFIIIPLLISGNRTLLFILILLWFLNQLRYLSYKKIFIIASGILISLVTVLTLINSAKENSALFRFKKIASLEYLYSSIETRLSPLFVSLKGFQSYEFLVGKGVGHTYLIPWFHYRKNIDDYNIYLDSLLPTLYGKYGLFCVLPIIIFSIALYYLSNKKSCVSYFLFFALLSLTNSFLYQHYLIFLLFFIYYIKVSNKVS